MIVKIKVKMMMIVMMIVMMIGMKKVEYISVIVRLGSRRGGSLNSS